MNNHIHVAICDSNTLARHGIISLLQSYKNLVISHESGNGLSFLKAVAASDFYSDVCIIDSDTNITGYDIFLALKKKIPGMKTLILSMFKSEMNILRYLKAGANGYIIKSSPSIEFYKAITTVHNNDYYFPRAILQGLFKAKSINNEDNSFNNVETEFLTLCASELTYKEIADKMHLSLKTIDSYRDSLFKRLNVRSRVGLVMFALKTGLIVADTA